MENSKTKIVFFGVPEFSVKILESMDEAGFTPELIVTAPDKPKGRKLQLTPPPVKDWAIGHDIKYIQAPDLKEPDLKSLLTDYDLFIVASYGKIIPKEILDLPKYGTLNVHTSLLPKLRGASPIQAAILEGEEKTGVTIMLMNEKLDAGPILATSELKLDNDITFLKLEEKLAEIGGEILVKTIPKWIAGEIEPIPQDDNEATFTKIITKKDGEIDWNEPVEIIHRKIRAFTPWPSTYTFHNGKRIIITKANFDKEKNELKIKRVKPEGKKEMDYEEFKRANPEFPY